MRRRLLKLLSTLSLLFGIAVYVLWARSYWHYDSVSYESAVGPSQAQYRTVISWCASVLVHFYSCTFPPEWRDVYISDYNDGRDTADFSRMSLRSADQPQYYP